MRSHPPFAIWFVVSILSVLLAGCVEVDDTPSPGEQAAAPKAVTGPGEMEALPLLADPWGNETERILVETRLSTAGCPTAAAWWNAGAGYATYGCALLALPEETLLPVGTARLQVEGDATGALKSGAWRAIVESTAGGRYLLGDASSSPKASWSFDLRPVDWDVPSATESLLSMSFYADGSTVSVLDGEIGVRLVAERDPEWRPLPVHDPWTATDEPRRVGPGVLRLADRNETWRFQRPVDGYVTGWQYPPPVTFAPIPEGTKWLAVAYTWATTDCPPRHDCSPNPSIARGTAYADWVVEERDDRRLVHVYEVASVGIDNPYAEESGARVSPFVWRCAEGIPLLGCFASFYSFGAAVDVRVVVEAWQDEVVPASVGATGGPSEGLRGG